VLPTAAQPDEEEEAAPVEAEDRDDELARLQRLLGMAAGKRSAAEDVEVLGEDVDLDEDADLDEDEDEEKEEDEDYYLDVDDGDGGFNGDD
jgi:hypothetical protein